jgi:hypothetical protein
MSGSIKIEDPDWARFQKTEKWRKAKEQADAVEQELEESGIPIKISMKLP